MKANKILKRISKIEALMSKVTDRSSASAPHIRELLRDAKAAVTRAKKAMRLQASSGTTKNPPATGAKHPSKATPEASKPKRKLSAAGRKAIVAATKKRWAAFHAAAKEAEKAEPAVPKKTARKKTASATAARNTVRKTAPKVAVKKTTPKKPAPAKTKRPVKKAVNNPAPVTAQPTASAEAAPTPEVVGV